MGMMAQVLGMTNKDSQFIEPRGMTRAILRPSSASRRTKLAIARATFSNIEQREEPCSAV